MKQILKHSRGVFMFACFTLNTFVLIVPILILALFKFLLPIAAVRREVNRLLMVTGEAWVAVNTLIIKNIGSIDWQARGLENLDRKSWYLLIANHQTWVDIVVLQKVFNRRIPFLKFFIKQQLIWFPLLGIAWWAMDMPFMKRYSKSYLAKHPHKKGRDLEATRKACEKFTDTPTTVINFVEGTRFSEHKRVARGSPYRHLLVPRAGGVALTMASMGELFNAVLDVTLVYPDGPAKFWNMCCGEHIRVIIDVRPRPIEPHLVSGDYANDREHRREFHRWLAELWQDKDNCIASVLQEVERDAHSGKTHSADRESH